ncbi:hypothetical protein BV898_06694 [Hypsibius exemplaris]|uniref:G-protein coupled receptors family 1 profile domain-containing protein n=1 Tax=Hypsibius exemplaris TaxID=2072580 RepID=A0A1W0WVN2_HYPEX|nr:hypothetical protein BV898_06694 [Hypsibius exemplaris]
MNSTVSLQFYNGTITNRTGLAPCPPIKPAEWMETQLPPLAFSTTIIATQLFNLIIFALWRNKDPYIFLHICLAVASFFAGLALASSVPLRYITLTPVNFFLTKFFGIAVLFYTTSASILANVAISLDRWLSVEFAIKYRTTITKKKALVAGILLTFVVPVVLSVPRYVIYWKDITVDRCVGTKHFSPKGIGAEFTEVMMGPVFLPLLFVSQLRILMIAAKQRLRRFTQTHRAVDAGHGPAAAVIHVGEVVSVLWSSFLGSMAIVVCALISHVPNYLMSVFVEKSVVKFSASTRRLGAYMTFIQHCVSPVIYLLFWPKYRTAVVRLFLRLRMVVTLHSSVATHSTHSHSSRRGTGVASVQHGHVMGTNRNGKP